GLLRCTCLCPRLLRLGSCDQVALEQRRESPCFGLGILQLSRIASKVGLRLVQLGLVLFEVGLRLADLTLWNPGIKREQQLTFADEVAFFEMNLEQFGGDLRLYGH